MVEAFCCCCSCFEEAVAVDDDDDKVSVVVLHTSDVNIYVPLLVFLSIL